MDKVETAVLFNALPQRMVNALFDIVPTHVRHFKSGTLIVHQIVTKEFYFAGQESEAIDTAIFFAALHQGLHAHADGQDWLGFHGLVDHVAYIESIDLAHAVADSANAGEDYAIGIFDHIGIGGNRDFGAWADVLKGFGNGMEVAHSVVDNGYMAAKITHRVSSYWTNKSKGALKQVLFIRSGLLAELKSTFCRWHNTGHTRIGGGGDSKGATKGFKDGLDLVMGIGAADIVDVH